MTDDKTQVPLDEEQPEDIPDEEISSTQTEEGASSEETSSPIVDETQVFYHKTISRLKREMLRAQKENATLKEKLKHSEQVSSQMGQSALESFKANALTLMEKAKAAKKHAHEVSDIESIVLADEELAKAAAQWQWAQTVPLPSQQNPEESNASESQEDPDPHPATQAWVLKNPWINQESSLFQGEKASAVISYATALEQQLVAQGRGHEINTPSYFKDLDTFVRYWDGLQGGHKTMKPVTTVAPTKGTPSEGGQKHKDALTADEKEICRTMNISEAGYLKQKKALALERAGQF
ncbi:hypothetical protein Cva_01378 [Caedimonas varicaedens]|uniref:Uncharacterized protein n=1 Tax=Caedimonas varicaedens TaxID=1629334 RepID=A0A0K8ME06_9PROT|nr:hypothetical protein Cva_01378 [Caedimonas varicaedens]